MEVFSSASLAAFAIKVTSVLKYLSAGQVREAITQVVPWLAGVIMVAVAAHANVSQDLVVFGEMALRQLNGWSQVLAGVALGSTGSFAYDLKKALDNTDTASEPPLGGGTFG